jgi:N-methylhydantoinase A
MAAEAASIVAQSSFGAATEERRIAYMRYAGQGHEIAVPLPARPLKAADVPAIRAAYDAEYTRFYDRPVPGSDVEVLSYSVTVATLQSPPAESPPPAPAYLAEPARTQLVRDTTTGMIAAWAVYERHQLRPGAHFDGPAIVAEAETSILAGLGWSGRVTGEGYIELIWETA